MVQTRSQKRAVFKLDVRSQKAQGIYNNTSNSLTGASASSAGAIQYATALPPSNPMPMARPRAHGTIKVGRKSKHTPGVFKGTSEECCTGQDKGHLLQAEGPTRNVTRSTHAITATRQGRPCARRRHTASGHTTSDQACDYEIWYNYVSDRYKANVYSNGLWVQEMFDFSLQELKYRLRIKQLDATSSSPLTKAVLWTSQPGSWDPKVEAVKIQAT